MSVLKSSHAVSLLQFAKAILLANALFTGIPIGHAEEKQMKFGNKVWTGRPSDEELKKTLPDLAFKVTRKDHTERATTSPLNSEKRQGIYVDIISNEPLFSSLDKYDSGTGWPSFSKPLEQNNITFKDDYKLFYGKRIEVRSKHADSHLGHVFDDGPAPTGKRYCMNGAALRFIPKEDLEKEGFPEYLKLFDSKN